MGKVDIRSLGVLVEFLEGIPAQQAAFAAECAAVAGRFENARYAVAQNHELARAEYAAALDAYREQEEPGWEDEERVAETERRVREWEEYETWFNTVADDAEERLQELVAKQERTSIGAARELEKRVAAARTYWSVPLPGLAGETAPMRKTAAGMSSGKSLVTPFLGGRGSATASILEQDGAQLPALRDGMEWVSLEKLDWGDVPPDMEFKKAGKEDMRAMLETFATGVVPALSETPGIDLDDFRQKDRAAGRNGPTEAYSAAYEFMLGRDNSSDTIALDAPHPLNGNRFGWQSGRHRALIARELGWKYIPARVIGRHP
ncbi:MAG: hypothetical protein K8F62_16145 [Pseudorhodoplanes sp.]|nr:hypothetical protein [Pseudorhodoplanes sp.]